MRIKGKTMDIYRKRVMKDMIKSFTWKSDNAIRLLVHRKKIDLLDYQNVIDYIFK